LLTLYSNIWFKGQVGAIQLGISRALQNWEPDMRTSLRAGKQDTTRILALLSLFSLIDVH